MRAVGAVSGQAGRDLHPAGTRCQEEIKRSGVGEWMRKIIKNSPVPLYYQLKEILQEMIDNEELKPNEPIPTERELCEIHGISRMTAREAIMALVNEGVLYREQGRGTFVAGPKPKYRLTELRGMTEDMERMGHRVETEILSFATAQATKTIRSLFGLEQDDALVYRIERLRIVDGEPYALETVWLDAERLKGMSRERLEGRSLYDVLRRDYSLQPRSARQTFEPVIMSDYEASLLRVDPGSLALLFHQTTYGESEEVIEYVKSIYRVDRYKFEIFLKS